MKFPTITSLVVSPLLALGLGSCGLEKSTTAPKQTRFLESTGTDTISKIDRLPFQHAWRDPKMEIAKYKYIVVRPVTTSFLKTDEWEQSKSEFVPDKRTYTRRVNALARHWDKSLNKAFSSPVCVFYKTTDTGRPGTLILEVALTEVRFDPAATKSMADPVTNGNVSNIITGLPLCAFEVRVKDAATGKVVSTASDRRGPEIKVVDADKKSNATPNERICDEWSQQLMESSNIDLFPKVKRNWFSLF
ncbi:MAG: DUF3313 family protein [Luteolibacter sp.]|uniref:DUF3313 family protein n=1 Tax=Luteolibacter sp. TaxID=1962973 RepID=UPI003264174B